MVDVLPPTAALPDVVSREQVLHRKEIIVELLEHAERNENLANYPDEQGGYQLHALRCSVAVYAVTVAIAPEPTDWWELHQVAFRFFREKLLRPLRLKPDIPVELQTRLYVRARKANGLEPPDPEDSNNDDVLRLLQVAEDFGPFLQA